MPEGDTIFRAARTLHRALAGKPVVALRIGVPRARPASTTTRRSPAGRSSGVIAPGKHVLMRFSGGLVLRTHMRMNGSWHIYRPGEAVAAAAPRHAHGHRDRRLRGGRVQHPGRGVHGRPAIWRGTTELRRLGPDLLGETFDAAEALAAHRARGRGD